MKNLIYAMLAVATTLMSCSTQDEPQAMPDVKNATQVTLSFDLPATSFSRVTEDEYNIPGKGRKISRVEYAIYDNLNHLILHSGQTDATQALKDPDDHGHFTLTVTLLKEHDYTFYVWASADAGKSPYTFDPVKREISVDYSKISNLKMVNDNAFEYLDAFFGKKKFTIADEQTADDQYTIILCRPFAQLNLLTNDEDKIQHTNKDRVIESTTVQIKQNPGRYTTLNLDTYLAGNPSPADNDWKFTFTYPNGWDDLIHAGSGDVADYHYLATCYLLTGIEADGTLNNGCGTSKQLTDIAITINFTDKTSVVINKSNVPIRRSWRTNIWGSLMTTDVDVNCRIDFGFADSYGDGPGADNGSTGPDDGDHSGDDNSNNETID